MKHQKNSSYLSRSATYGDLAEMSKVILKAVDENFVTKAEFQARSTEVDKRFDQIDIRFNQVDRRFERIEERLDKIERKMDKLTTMMVEIVGELKTIREEIIVGFHQVRRHTDQIEIIGKHLGLALNA